MKKALRQFIRQQKSLHSTLQLTDYSKAVCHSVMSDGLWRTAGTVLLYYPLADEVDVRLLLEHALHLGHQVLLPVVVGECTLELRYYNGPASLRKGAFGIMEPTGPIFPCTLYNTIHLAVIPGMAFDAQGHRLGRGRGYYDRLLPQLASAYLLGVCFPFQMVEHVPFETHDCCVDEVVFY